ncbi:GntR family transcriptional regulator [Bosea vestrisii]|uniref:GntR family transcriptional regulator n=1 Tax=Bosea vestrisii TaxID=151416 RepID=UPI0024DFE4AC|nr:GntR family transcriptional regulator [Bosea vestrisii]WID95214.1 GntR family transcriptional regulator [Bosea vestrisii]
MSDTIVQKKTISSQVADVLRKRILSGEYEAGTRLRQEHIASEIGVSRIPVREALHQLHSEGYVTLVSQKGAVVSAISLGEILEMFELRARVETWLLALAIPRMTEIDFAKAQDALEHFSREGRHSEYSHALNWKFHSALYEPSGRVMTIDLVAKIHQQIERYTRLMVSLAGSQEKASREHALLLALCRTGDVERAVALLDQHITDGGQFLVERITALRAKEPADVSPEPKRRRVAR